MIQLTRKANINPRPQICNCPGDGAMTKEGSGPTEQLTAVTAGRLEAETAVLIVAHMIIVNKTLE